MESFGSTSTPSQTRPAWWREPKWWLAIAGGVALVGFGVLFTLLLLLRSLPPDSPKPSDSSKSPGAVSGWVRLGKETAAEGIAPANQHHDGVTAPSQAGGMECHSLQLYPGRPELYAYFRIDPALRNQLTNGCIVEI